MTYRLPLIYQKRLGLTGHLVIKFAHLLVKKPRRSCGYAYVFCLHLCKFFSKSNQPNASGILILTLLSFFTGSLFAQSNAEVYGKISDGISGEPIEIVLCYIDQTNVSTESDARGNYVLPIPPGQAVELIFSRLGYKEARVKVSALPLNSRKRIDLQLAPNDADIEIVVRESLVERNGMIEQNVESLKLLPSVTGNLESVLPHIALGASSGTGGELTSQYNVRGGNYDENLVYVNGFEIYRPQLVSSSEQEGLSFPNIDLIQSLSFSSGGFEAKYGDKMSSVLDVQYKRPDSLAASVTASLLGASGHVEGALSLGNSSYRKLRYLGGIRYRTTKYILGSLDVTGQYQPSFLDLQTYLTYDLSRDLQLGLLANYNLAKYDFEPEVRNTAFGLINFALNLNSTFEGREVDEFNTAMGGLSLTYIPDRDRNPFYVKLLTAINHSDERESLDIQAFYRLSQIEADIGSDNQGDELVLLGEGTQHEFIRTRLATNVSYGAIQGGKEWNKNFDAGYRNHFLQWGVKFQREDIDDRINEWERLDSAGFSLPANPDSVLLLRSLKSENEISSNRFSGFIQNTFSKHINDRSEIRLIAGVRGQYWDLNDEFLISPRAQILLKPLKGKGDVTYRLAGGLYSQPAFYRELRRPDGTLNRELKSQKSAHIVGGLTYDFLIGDNNPKKFRFITEIYYKKLWDIVSYEVDNVRIRYSGENDTEGYVLGWDFRLNGEFVPGAESWINLSFLRARENILNVQHQVREVGSATGTEVDFVPRPTDRFLNVNIFFQDYLPSNENFRVHLNVSFATGLPFGVQDDNQVYRNTYRYSEYRRLDMGFSAQLWKNKWKAKHPNNPFRFARSAWVSFEIFNLLNVQNVASNTWVRAVTGTQFAVPNELTSRRVNVKMRVDF